MDKWNSRRAYLRMMLFLSSPKQSLQVLDTILKKKHEASGLRINTSKSELYSICLGDILTKDIKQFTSYRWIFSQWKYLGMVIPLDLTNIYKENFIKLFQILKTNLLSLTKQKFSWYDRIRIAVIYILAICLPDKNVTHYYTEGLSTGLTMNAE